MTIYLIRHGATDWNRAGRLQGSSDIPLNQQGRQEAIQTAAGMRWAGLAFRRVYASPLSRALETARILSGGQIPIRTDQRLAEIDFGDWEGKLCVDPAECVPAPGGETLEQLRARTTGFMEDLVRDPENAEGPILVATHGTVIKSIVAAVQEIPLPEFWARSRAYSNCGVAILEADAGGSLRVQAQNVTYF